MTRAIIALILLLPLAGCLGGQTLEGGGATVALWAPCEGQSWCHRETLPDGRVAYVLENMDFRAPNGSIQVKPTGDEVVIVRNLTIQSPTGIYFADHDCTACLVRLENLRFIGGNVAIEATHRDQDSRATYQFRDLSISGYRHAMVGPANLFPNEVVALRLEMDGVHVDCVNTGLRIFAKDALLQRVNVTGCNSDGMNLYVYGNGTVRDSSFNDSLVGLHPWIYGQLRIDSSKFVGNRYYGLQAYREVAPAGYMEITNSVFKDNGHQPIPGSEGGAILTMATGFVHGSHFESNAGWALQPPPFEVYDATDNYWGDPMGPRLCQGSTLPQPPGSGDCVYSSTRFIPFRSAP